METKALSPLAVKFLADAKAYGINEDRLKRYESSPILSNFLPTSGTFEKYDFAGDEISEEDAKANGTTAGNFKHPRMITDKGDSISLSAIKIIAIEKGQPVKFKQSALTSKLKGGYVIAGGRAINPRLNMAEAQLVDYLTGKKFTAEPVDVQILPYKVGGWQELPTEKELNVKTVYKITVE